MSHSPASKSAPGPSTQTRASQVSSHYKGAKNKAAAKRATAKRANAKNANAKNANAKRSANAKRATAVRTSRMDAPPPTNFSQNAVGWRQVSQPSTHKQPAALKGAPLIVKRYVRWLFGKNETGKNVSGRVRRDTGVRDTGDRDTGVRDRTAHGKTAHGKTGAPQKVFLATGSVATLALLAVVPGQVASHSIDDASCQEVVQSGAEISRGKLASLAAVPTGATHDSVRALIDVPYCLLPVPSEKATQADVTPAAANGPIVAREAYPLAFDPEAWVIVSYSESGYAGYDFAFKP
ncbi:MAG: hypothetical protein AB8B99_17260 [Phormidesmis sp.]